LGNFGTEKIDSPNMRPFQVNTGGRAWKAIRGQTSKTMLPE